MTAMTLSPAERLRALAAEQLERDGWTREQLLAYQERRVRALLRHAAACSPYYRRTLRPERPLAEQPVLPKATLMEQWDRIVCDDRLTLAAATAHAGGPHAAEPLQGEFQIFSTSGASGLRGVIAYSARDWAVAMASALRGLARTGARPDMRIVGIGAPGGVHMSKRIFAGFQSARGDAPELSALTPLPEMVAALNAYQPEVLVGYCSVGALLAAEQLAGRLDIAPRIVAFGSEPLPMGARERIEAAWGIDPCEYYVSTEAPTMACSTPGHPRALEVLEDLHVVEVVDEDDRPVPPGTAGAKVLVTNLDNYTLPLIRYELADRVTISPDPNPAGRPYVHLAAIDGRTADTLTFPARDGGEVAVLPLRLGAPFARLPEVRQFQIVHEHGALEVRVVLEAAAPTDRVRAAVAAALEAAGAVVPEIRVTPVEHLEREPGAAAKLKLIVARQA
jgi:phenylacetate-coenzyme A ligase PaaK-like adenylate-forming protein